MDWLGHQNEQFNHDYSVQPVISTSPWMFPKEKGGSVEGQEVPAYH